jgi:hypothetical protein
MWWIERANCEITGLGSPFSIILEESGVTTTCNLNTYEPEDPEEIPFKRGWYFFYLCPGYSHNDLTRRDTALIHSRTLSDPS